MLTHLRFKMFFLIDKVRWVVVCLALFSRVQQQICLGSVLLDLWTAIVFLRFSELHFADLRFLGSIFWSLRITDRKCLCKSFAVAVAASLLSLGQHEEELQQANVPVREVLKDG